MNGELEDLDRYKETYDLTNEQTKAFTSLKRAYNKCKKVGVLFANHYSHLTAYDSAKVTNFGFNGDIENDGNAYRISEAGYGLNSIDIPMEFSDDQILHAVALTDEWKQELESRKEDE